MKKKRRLRRFCPKWVNKAARKKCLWQSSSEIERRYFYDLLSFLWQKREFFWLFKVSRKKECVEFWVLAWSMPKLENHSSSQPFLPSQPSATDKTRKITHPRHNKTNEIPCAYLKSPCKSVISSRKWMPLRGGPSLLPVFFPSLRKKKHPWLKRVKNPSHTFATTRQRCASCSRPR